MKFVSASFNFVDVFRCNNTTSMLFAVGIDQHPDDMHQRSNNWATQTFFFLTTLNAYHISTNSHFPFLFDFFAPSSWFFNDRFFELFVDVSVYIPLKMIDLNIWKEWIMKWDVTKFGGLKIDNCRDTMMCSAAERSRETEVFVVKEGCVVCVWAETTRKKAESISRWVQVRLWIRIWMMV